MAKDPSSFPIDLAETDQGFLLRATLPGVSQEDVQITIDGETLTIRAESKSQEERKEGSWLVREQRSGHYQRLISLPAPVNPEQAQATFKDGILELSLPRAEQARSGQIKVGGAPQEAGANGAGGMTRAAGTASTASVSPPTAPATPAEKSPVTQASEESMDASDPPSWTRERT